MIRHPLSHMGHEGDRHRLAPASRQERRVRRLLRIAGRVHAAGAQRLDAFNQRAIELNGQQHEPNRKGIR